MKGKVYLLANWDANKFKIGITRGKVEKRLKQLQTGNGEKIEILQVFETEHFLKVEKSMHRRYGHKKSKGEWFELSDEDIIAFQVDCQTSHNLFQMLIDSGNPFV
jgi:hypothetical protein|tara:strand:- start:1489 stop:1803 length:315 start_codon:yes stop_codon:yes gene_type:complete